MFMSDKQRGKPMRMAIYARYSSDLQRPVSIEDQVRQCMEVAAWKGWEIARDYIRSDKAKSGRTLVGREGLDRANAKRSCAASCCFSWTSLFLSRLGTSLPAKM